MTFVWSKGNSILSRIIMWMTGDDCSHFSIVLYSGSPWEIMYESNLMGTHPAFYKTFLKKHTVVHEKKISCTEAEEDSVLAEIVDFYDGCDYDFKGALFLGLWKLIHRVTGLKIPEKNLWSDPNKYYCEELISCARKLKSMPQIPTANAMRTPHDTWEYFK